MIEAELRVTGQVLDVGTGRVIGGFKATGAIRDLFGIEDIVAGQIRQQLVGEITGTPVDPAASMEPVLMEPAPEPPQESQEAADTQMVAEIPPYDTYGQMRSIYDVPLVSVYPPVLITPPYPPVWYGDDDDDDHDHDGNWDGRRSRFTPIGLRRRPGGGITHPNGVYVRGPRHVMRGGPSHVMRGGFGSVARPPTSSTR
jgi:hypothetical protein